MNQVEKWEKIEIGLRAAFSLLPENIVESDNGYRESNFLAFFEANELLLAMEELDGVIENNPNPGKVLWEHLLKAASLMEHLHANRYKSILASTT